jgi:hypothetical protein
LECFARQQFQQVELRMIFYQINQPFFPLEMTL